MNVLAFLADTRNSQRITSRLEANGYQVIRAENERDAGNILGKNRIQLVILDFNIVATSFTAKIRQLDSGDYIYTIGLIADTEREKEISADQSIGKADEYLVKPVEPDELLSRLGVVDRYIKILSNIRTSQGINEPIRDVQTGTYTRSTILELLQAEVNRSYRTHNKFVLALLSIDNATNIQKNYGKEIYSKTLLQIALKLWASVRAYDLIGRWGEHSFMIMLPETTMSSAVIVAERIRKNISNVPMNTSENGLLKLSASLGAVLCGQQDFASMDELITAAEKVLEKANQAGGNQIVYSWDNGI